MHHVKKRAWRYANSIKMKLGPQVRVITYNDARETFKLHGSLAFQSVFLEVSMGESHLLPYTLYTL